MDFLTALEWRYAAKRMTGESIPEPVLSRILEATRLAPSSYGLQPYTIKVISDRAELARIHEEAAPQPQVKECSHLLVFATMTDLDASTVDQYMQLTASERGLDVAALNGFSEAIKGTINGFATTEKKHAWAAKQAYIALGFTLAAAAVERIDASPMEGFDPAALDRTLGLDKENLSSVVIVALGYRDPAQDPMSQMAKVRKPYSRLIQTV
ncbi:MULTISPECIES: nitroreductase family protein [Marinobacter]|uniref:nitroreductase family protein n=1 Tax=Marinobacter TaxID=2742 RepID=UPI001247B486|nr:MULTISPECIES: nitroreductase family protein [Marinobacter]MBL3556950.1 nitroreductase family protein [Marinobacter sp. JB05H06]